MKNKKNNLKEFNKEELFNILKSGKFDKFERVRENDIFDAKSIRPYDLDNADSDKRLHAIAKLSSDITSFANQKGGFIVCGLDTPHREDTPHDIVSSINLIKEKEFYSNKLITGIIKSSVYPLLKIQVKWYPSSIKPNMGLGVIYIPKQDEAKKYFIICVCESGGKKFKGFVGIPIRVDDQTSWLSVKDIYKSSKRKPSDLQELAQSFSNQLQESETRLSQKIDNLSKKPQLKIKDLLESKILETLHEQD